MVLCLDAGCDPLSPGMGPGGNFPPNYPQGGGPPGGYPPSSQPGYPGYPGGAGGPPQQYPGYQNSGGPPGGDPYNRGGYPGYPPRPGYPGQPGGPPTSAGTPPPSGAYPPSSQPYEQYQVRHGASAAFCVIFAISASFVAPPALHLTLVLLLTHRSQSCT